MSSSRKERITQTLNEHIPSLFLEIMDESHRHHVPEDAETHFKVTLVSEEFNGIPFIKRHRQVNKILTDEFKNGLHALSIHAFTPSEWEKKQHKTNTSPPCRDGFEK